MLYDRPENTATAIWDDATGETWDEALARFSTFGPLMDAREAIAYLSDPQAVSLHPVMSFGYGDDPVDFDEVTLEDFLESCDDPDEADRDWGPFAIWADA